MAGGGGSDARTGEVMNNSAASLLDLPNEHSRRFYHHREGTYENLLLVESAY